MANVTEAYGLKPTRQLNGSPFINAQNRYRIASNNSTAIFQGDLVKPLTTGTITRTIANPGSIAASDIIALVVDAPDTVFEIKANAVFAVADLFQNYSVTNVSGSTATGISSVKLDVANSGTVGTFMVQAIDISQDPSNSDVNVSNISVLVRINNHFFRQGGTGV